MPARFALQIVYISCLKKTLKMKKCTYSVYVHKKSSTVYIVCLSLIPMAFFTFNILGYLNCILGFTEYLTEILRNIPPMAE